MVMLAMGDGERQGQYGRTASLGQTGIMLQHCITSVLWSDRYHVTASVIIPPLCYSSAGLCHTGIMLCCPSYQFCDPQWGTADAELSPLCCGPRAVKCSPFKALSRSEVHTAHIVWGTVCGKCDTPVSWSEVKCEY